MNPLRLFQLLLILGFFALDLTRACHPGRGGIRRRGARKLKPLVYKEHFPNYSERSLASSGLNTGVVSRESKRFRELVVNLNPDVKFRDEEGTGADRLMTQVGGEMLGGDELGSISPITFFKLLCVCLVQT